MPRRSFLLRADQSIVYEPKITKEPVYMEDLVEDQVGVLLYFLSETSV